MSLEIWRRKSEKDSRSGKTSVWRAEGDGAGWGACEVICPQLEAETLRELACTAGEGCSLRNLVHWTDVCGGKTGSTECGLAVQG